MKDLCSLTKSAKLDISLQAKLLRIIQGEAVRTCGRHRGHSMRRPDHFSHQPKSQDRSRRQGVPRGLILPTFRIPISLPPLRKRPGDIRLLAEHFLNKFSGQEHKGKMRFAPSAIRELELHRWSGNVRELQATIQRAVLLEESDTISDFFPPLSGSSTDPPSYGRLKGRDIRFKGLDHPDGGNPRNRGPRSAARHR